MSNLILLVTQFTQFNIIHNNNWGNVMQYIYRKHISDSIKMYFLSVEYCHN